VEFAQCGLRPILELAGSLGIGRQVLVDGDSAGQYYAQAAEEALGREASRELVTQLPAVDIETYLWDSGFDEVYRAAARRPKRVDSRRSHEKPRSVIAKAIRSRSKPYLALSVVEACAARGPAGIPPLLQKVIERVVRTARDG
jgi:putative ATP-dependent endonuclease of OLD family